MTYQPLPAKTLLDYFNHAVRCGKPSLLVSKVGGEWKSISSEEFGQRTKAFALGLSAMGILQGDRVAILSENRPEWAMTDYATLGLGGITVPIYTTFLAPQVEYILRDCAASVLVVSNARELEKVAQVRKRCPDLKHIVLLEGALPNEEIFTSFDAVVRRGQQVMATEPAAWDEHTQLIGPDTHATIIYTSGTTGEPKGAVLSHGNFVSNVSTCSSFFDLDQTYVAMSFLPLAHVFERMIEYVYYSRGTSIAFAESIEKLADNLQEVKPHCFAAVPRVYEKIHQRINQTMDSAPPLRKKLFDWAVAVGRERIQLVEKGKPLPGILDTKFKVANKLVFGKIKGRLGGRFRYCISGGAPLGREVAEFFWGAGVEIFEGYGLTETSPVLTCNRPDGWRLGSVGRPIPGVIIKIAEDGEVLAKGPNIMKGYWGKPEETKKSIDTDGWFCTGDVGHIDRDGFLTLTDRKKELIVTAYGKNIAPAPIEGALKQIRYIGTAVLIGDRRKFLSALIVPNFDRLEAWAVANGVEFRSREELIRNPKVRSLYQQTVDIVNGDEPSEKRIKTFALLANDFSIEGGELTPTLKVKRRVISQKYSKLIDAMYDAAEANESVLESQGM